MKQYLPLFLMSMLVFQAMCNQYYEDYDSQFWPYVEPDNSVRADEQMPSRPIYNDQLESDIKNKGGEAWAKGSAKGEGIRLAHAKVGNDYATGLEVKKGAVEGVEGKGTVFNKYGR